MGVWVTGWQLVLGSLEIGLKEKKDTDQIVTNRLVGEKDILQGRFSLNASTWRVQVKGRCVLVLFWNHVRVLV